MPSYDQEDIEAMQRLAALKEPQVVKAFEGSPQAGNPLEGSAPSTWHAASRPTEALTPDLANRFRYHPPATEEVRRLHEEVRGRVWTLAQGLDEIIPTGREKALMLTHLEEALMWANAAIARAPRED